MQSKPCYVNLYWIICMLRAIFQNIYLLKVLPHSIVPWFLHQIWWLDAELTCGQTRPLVFTQGHSVCNRSFFPCFDTPAVKSTYSATVRVSLSGSDLCGTSVLFSGFRWCLLRYRYQRVLRCWWVPQEVHTLNRTGFSSSPWSTPSRPTWLPWWQETYSMQTLDPGKYEVIIPA